MGIGEQFKGLDMKNLIGGPLTAAAESSVLLARSTANFINQVGFDSNQKARTVMFKFNKQEPEDDGSLNSQEMAVDVPLLAIVPIPNLQIDEVNVLFDMEVKECEKSESSMSGSGSFSAKVGWGPVSVRVSGSVSAHSSNTRSSDNSAKYHVDVRATNHGIPEGLARVLDMMAASVSPNLIGSRPVDASGTELTGARRERNLKLKSLREERMQLENSEGAARETRDIKLEAFKREVQIAQNKALSAIRASLDSEKDAAKKSALERRLESVDNFWNTLQISAGDKVSLAAVSEKKELSGIYPPLKSGETVDANTKTDAIESPFKLAVNAYMEWETSNKKLQDNKVEYNNVMMGVSGSSGSGGTGGTGGATPGK